jgi:integrase
MMEQLAYDRTVTYQTEQGFAMNGSIRCVRCHSGIDERGDGICPKCKKPKSYEISFYWSHGLGGDGKHHTMKFHLDWTHTRAKLRRLRSDLDNSAFEPSEWGLTEHSPNSLELRMTEWLKEIDGLPPKDMAPSTRRLYHTQAKKVLASSTAKLDVRKLDHDDYKAIFAAASGRNSSKKTLRATVRVFLTWCRAKRYILNMPLLPRVKGGDEKEKYVLTPEQQEQALGRLPEERTDLYGFMMNIGARVSETLTLQAKDVKLERSAITINRTYSDDDVEERTKTRRARTLPLTDKAMEILKRNLTGKVGCAFVFSHPDGRPYTYDEIADEWSTMSGFKVPLKDATRRSWATRMRNSGVPIEVISAGLGHTTIAMTQKYLDGDVTWARDIFNRAEVMQFEQSAKRARNEKTVKNP